MEKLDSFLNFKHVPNHVIFMTSHICLGELQDKLKHMSYKEWYMIVHCTIICRRLKLKTTKMFISMWLGNRLLVCVFAHILDKETATHSSILAWEITRTEELGGLQSVGSQKRKNLVTKQQQQQIYIYICMCICVCIKIQQNMNDWYMKQHG